MTAMIQEWFPGKGELTLEGLIGQQKVKAVLLFSQPLSYHEATIARLAWEKGLEQGIKMKETL